MLWTTTPYGMYSFVLHSPVLHKSSKDDKDTSFNSVNSVQTSSLDYTYRGLNKTNNSESYAHD